MITFRVFPAAAVLGLSCLLLLPTPVPAAPTEIEVVDRIVGTGPEPRKGWFAIIRYTGWIYDEQAADKKGKRFINSDDRGAPVSFAGQKVRSWIAVGPTPAGTLSFSAKVPAEKMKM